jgi:cystine transport system substrate-binding protein
MAPRRLIGRAGLLLAASTALLLPATGTADPVAGLKAKAADLAAHENQVLLDLYALDSRLEGAQTDLAEVQSRIASLERMRASNRNGLRVAKRTLAIAQQRLAEQVRALYQEDRPDPLAIVLGASSVEDAIDGLDAIRRAARATTDVADQASAARVTLRRRARALAERQRALESLRATARAREALLVAARSARADYLSQLREEQRLNDRQIVLLQARARAAQARSALETVKAETTATVESIGAQAALAAPDPAIAEADPPRAPAPEPAPAPAQASVTALAGKRLTVIATAYSLPGNTASGLPTGPGVVAVDPTVIPMGTRMTIPGYGEGIAADVGTAIKGNRIDVWFPELEQARAWGAKTVTITLH